MKCSELYRLLTKKGTIIFPNHGSQEMGKGLENKILKDAGLN